MAFGTMLLGTGVLAAARRRGLALAAIFARSGGTPLLPGTGAVSPLRVLLGAGDVIGWTENEAVCEICPSCCVSTGWVMTGDRRPIRPVVLGSVPPRRRTPYPGLLVDFASFHQPR